MAFKKASDINVNMYGQPLSFSTGPVSEARLEAFFEKMMADSPEYFERCVYCNLVDAQCVCKAPVFERPCPACDWTGVALVEKDGNQYSKRCTEPHCVEVLNERTKRVREQQQGEPDIFDLSVE